MKFKVILQLILLLSFVFSSSCGMYRKTDARTIPTDGLERARKNVNEGRGVSLSNLGKNKTSYEFATSNPLWRAALTTIDFLPLNTVDYSGGIIITDWYSESLSNDSSSIKITINFLSNEVRSDSIKIIVHQKECDKNNKCIITNLKSKISSELQETIIKQAAIFEKEKK